MSIATGISAGLLFLANITSPPLYFVRRNGSSLIVDNRPFRFVSMNVPNLLAVQDLPVTQGMWIPATPYEQEDAFQSIVGLGGRVIRTYTFGIGLGQHITARRTYNEEMFKAVDTALALANKYRVYLIIPFLNNMGYAAVEDFAKLSQGKDFYRDQSVIDDFKHFINYVLTRKNTVTGVEYRNDPAILAWQLGNEYGSWTDPTPPDSWILDISQFVKSVDQNHLVMDGTLAGHNSSRFSIPALQSSSVDIFYNNYYWGQEDVSSNRIVDHANYVKKYNKPFIICEFGLSDISVYTNVLDISRQLGISAMIWSLRFHSREGGFYVHSEGDKYKSYHVPGFPYKEGFNTQDEKEVVDLFQKEGFLAQGRGIPKIVPTAPQLFYGSQGHIKWRGSAWAQSYVLERSDDGKNWYFLANLTDAMETGKEMFIDSTKGQSLWYYRMRAFGSGGASPPSSIIFM